VPKPPVIQESCKQVDATENGKRNIQNVVSKFSCGASEMISKAGESGMFFKVEINDKVLEFLVDTGATITLVSRNSTMNIVDSGSLKQLNSDVVIADGTSLNVYGVQVLPLSIQGRQFQCKMVVADLTVDNILGLDFLQSNNCTLNMSDCSLTMQNPDVRIPCHYIGKIGCYRINLSENIALLS
jgi:predicted aspartyl protease